MASSPKDVYAEFLKKVERTLFVDCLSPLVTESVLKSALNQFGMVKNVQIIPNFLGPEDVPMCALVEMNNSKEAQAIISELSRLPFIICGMPRPVRARPALPEMFEDRPAKPGRLINCHWLDKNDIDFETATELKNLVTKHVAETRYLLEKQLERDHKLADQQSETLKINFSKYKLIQSAFTDHSLQDLACLYDLKTGNDR